MDKNKLTQSQANAFLDDVIATAGENFVLDQEEANQAIAAQAGLYAQLAIKILTGLGGVLASIFFNGFLLLGGLGNSPAGLVVAGIIFIFSAIAAIRVVNSTLAETACISLNLIGYAYLGYGLSGLQVSEEAFYAIFMVFSLGQFFLASRYIFIFASVLIFNGSLAGIILMGKDISLLNGFICITALLLTFLSVKEPFFISKNAYTNRVYRPVYMGLIISLVGALLLMQHHVFLRQIINHAWIAAVILPAGSLYIISQVIHQAGLTTKNRQWLIWVGVGVVLAPTFFIPSVAGAILIILLGFYLGHTTSFSIGIVALVYFVSQYYYDLQITLLTKSIILMATGAVFIAGYILLQKITPHEKN